MGLCPTPTFMAEQPLYELNNIQKRFGPVTALNGVSLKVYPGEVLGLVGDNGAGKSTLMKVASGAVIPDEGEVLLNGESVRFRAPSEARAQRIEMVYQDLSLCNSLNVATNIFLGREPVRSVLGLKFLDHQTLHQEAERILEELHIKIPSTRGDGQKPCLAVSGSLSPSVVPYLLTRRF